MGEVIQLRDWDWLRPPDEKLREGSAEVVFLPVVRVERCIEEILKPKRRRRSLLAAGEPP